MVGAEWDKAHKKAATDLFRLVQIYMGDRKARPGMTLNSVAQDILHAAFSNEKLVFMYFSSSHASYVCVRLSMNTQLLVKCYSCS